MKNLSKSIQRSKRYFISRFASTKIEVLHFQKWFLTDLARFFLFVRVRIGRSTFSQLETIAASGQKMAPQVTVRGFSRRKIDRKSIIHEAVQFL